jgi:hypothetical protein
MDCGLGELERATLTTDIMNIVALVEQFRVQHPALFEYTTLLALIQEAKHINRQTAKTS